MSGLGRRWLIEGSRCNAGAKGTYIAGFTPLNIC